MNFPLIQFKNFEKWIPSTDVDEIDAQPGVLTNVENADFRNGYIETTQNVTALTHPTDIATDISNGYELLSQRGFTHSVKGNTTIYVLYKEGASPLVKIWLTGGGELSPKLMDIDEQNSDIAWLERPHDINYSLVNDQLKINLNCLVKYTDIGNKEVIANLTLLYIDEREYQPDILIRSAGWYLTPRWLGWQEGYVIEDSSNLVDIDENLIDGSISDSRLSIKNGATISTAGVNLRDVGSTLMFTGVCPRILSFTAATPPKVASYVPVPQELKVVCYSSSGEILQENSITVKPDYAPFPLLAPLYRITINNPRKTATIEISKDQMVEDDIRDCRIYRVMLSLGYYNIHPFNEDYDAEFLLVGLTKDGQRGKLPINSNAKVSGSTSSATKLKIPTANLDWRYIQYELYFKYDTIWYLCFYISLDEEERFPATWSSSGGYLIASMKEIEVLRDTLAYKYGLPGDTRVDNQRHIYQEVEHKGRVFFVNEDYKVYQSHISANLAIQADSFPYDEEVGFGYFITAHNRINKGIAVTPTNYLAIFTDSGFYVYFIQPSSTGSFKVLRLSSGSIGLSSRNSITRAITGDPATDGLFWVDDNGVYFYTGDSQPPRNLILPTHEKYWKEKVTDKNNAVGFYNPVKREYWLQVKDSSDENLLIAYELPYDSWKKYNFGYRIDEYYGIFNNVVYYRSANTFVKFDTSKKSALSIITPYNTGSIAGQMGYQRPVPEIYDKILQETYIVFADGNDNEQVLITVYVDGVNIISYTLNANVKFNKLLTPLGVRFNRVSLTVSNVNSDKVVRIKEFGCSYTLDTKEPLGQYIVDDQPVTAGYGYGRSYGRAYGRN